MIRVAAAFALGLTLAVGSAMAQQPYMPSENLCNSSRFWRAGCDEITVTDRQPAVFCVEGAGCKVLKGDATAMAQLKCFGVAEGWLLCHAHNESTTCRKLSDCAVALGITDLDSLSQARWWQSCAESKKCSDWIQASANWTLTVRRFGLSKGECASLAALARSGGEVSAECAK